MESEVVAVVLAAGRATRFGAPKLLVAVDGTPLVERALAAAAGRRTIVVASAAVAAHLARHCALGAGTTVVVNDEPERGMAHSLRLADAAAPRGAALLVLLADMPNVDAALADRVVAASGPGVDIVAPYAGSTPAHPVLIGPRARSAIAELPDGDSIRRLRESKYYRRVQLDLGDARYARDIDRPADLEPEPAPPLAADLSGRA